jgi:DNA polymerase III subunit beta
VKFRCERDILADALTTAGRAATSRTNSLPVLSGVRLDLRGDVLTVTATDIELTIRTDIEVAGQQDGSSVIPARLIAEIVRNLPGGSVSLSAADDEVAVTSGRSEFSVRPLSLADYPQQTESEIDAVSLSSVDVGDAFRQVVRAASTDEARVVLTGVLIAAEDTGIKMVATDSYRLAVRDLPQSSMLESGQKVLIPGRALNEVQRLLGGSEELKVRLGTREAVFESGSTRLTTRLIEGEYPNYRNLLPTSAPNQIIVGRDDLLDALRRVKILARDTTPVRLKLAADQLTLNAVTQDIGNASEHLDAKYSGQEMEIAFNPDYLFAGVEATEGEEISLSVTDPGKPAVVRGVGHDEYLYLLMPVRI